jgi:hypothetical protein
MMNIEFELYTLRAQLKSLLKAREEIGVKLQEYTKFDHPGRVITNAEKNLKISSARLICDIHRMKLRISELKKGNHESC